MKIGDYPPTGDSDVKNVFEGISKQDADNAKDATSYRLIGRAAEALAAACEANGVPLNALLPLVSHLAGEFLNTRFKHRKHPVKDAL